MFQQSMGPDRGGRIGTPTPSQGGVVNQQGLNPGRGFNTNARFGVQQYYGGMTDQAGEALVNAIVETKIVSGGSDKQRINRAIARQEARDFDDWLLTKREEYEQLEGPEALNLPERFNRDFEEEAARRMEGLPPDIRQAASEVHDQYRQQGMNWAVNKRRQQLDVQEEKQFQDDVSDVTEYVRANPDDLPGALELVGSLPERHSQTEGRQAQIAGLPGTLQATAVQARLDQGQLNEARELLSRGGDLSPQKAERLQARIDRAQKEQDRLAAASLVENRYGQISEELAGLDPEEAETAGQALIGQIEDPALKSQVEIRFKADQQAARRGRALNDARAANQFLERVQSQNLIPSQALAEAETLPGISGDAREKLRQRIIAPPGRPTAENVTATREMRAAIDRREGLGRDDLEIYAFEKGLTSVQKDSLQTYLKEGGQTDRLTQTSVDRAYLDLTGQKPPADMDLYQLLRDEWEPGQKVTRQTMRKELATLVRSRQARSPNASGPQRNEENYARAAKEKRPDGWLPGVNAREKAEITEILRAQGRSVSEENIRRYKKQAALGVENQGVS